MSSAIDIKDLSICYRSIRPVYLKKGLQFASGKRSDAYQAVRGVSFSVEEGEIVGIIGENGSGKSTLLRGIAGIISPDGGTIDIHQRSISLLAIGVGFQKGLTGRENIMLSGMLLGFSREQVESKMSEIIAFSELGPFIKKPVKTYSSGMYSKLAFAITAVLETDIILIDEVLSVGDTRFKKKSFRKMKELILDESRTVLIVSHSVDTLRSLCSRVIWMHRGEIRMIGESGKVLDEYMRFVEEA